MTDGHSPFPVSAIAKRLWTAIAHQDWETANKIESTHPEARDELIAWELIDTDGDIPIVCHPKRAIQHQLELQLLEAKRRVELMLSMPELAGDLYQVYQQSQSQTGHGTSVYLDDPNLVNTRIQNIVGSARREILTAQPGGPRSRELLDMAQARDTAALDRGVELRTIYRSTVRDHPVTAEYARMMSTRTAGRPAKFRTLDDPFERMIIVDRQYAFVSDHVVPRSPEHSAWLITDPAAVAVLAAMWESNWRRAQPWTGELRPAQGRTVRQAVDPDGVRTTAEQRAVMRLMCAGVSQIKTAKQMGWSQRKLEEQISVLKGLWGVRTLNELIYQYALSPDRTVDDGEQAAGAHTAHGSAA